MVLNSKRILILPFPSFSSSNTADGFLGDYRLTLYDNPSPTPNFKASPKSTALTLYPISFSRVATHFLSSLPTHHQLCLQWEFVWGNTIYTPVIPDSILSSLL